MTIEAKLDSMSTQLAQLLQHVAEVRRTNVKLAAQYDSLRGDVNTIQDDMKSMRDDMKSIQDDMKSMRQDIHALDAKFDKNTQLLSGKIEHHVKVLREESMEQRTRFEDDRYIRDYRHREIVSRLDDVEERVARLEAQRS